MKPATSATSSVGANRCLASSSSWTTLPPGVLPRWIGSMAIQLDYHMAGQILRSETGIALPATPVGQARRPATQQMTASNTSPTATTSRADSSPEGPAVLRGPVKLACLRLPAHGAQGGGA